MVTNHIIKWNVIIKLGIDIEVKIAFPWSSKNFEKKANLLFDSTYEKSLYLILPVFIFV